MTRSVLALKVTTELKTETESAVLQTDRCQGSTQILFLGEDVSGTTFKSGAALIVILTYLAFPINTQETPNISPL